MAKLPKIPVKRRSIKLPSKTPVFENVTGILNPPMEITVGEIPGINMVDETIIVRDSLKRVKE